MAIGETEAQIQTARSQADLASKQISQYKSSLPNEMAQTMLRAKPGQNPLMQQLQRNKVVQAKNVAEQAQQQVEQYKQQVEDYATQFEAYKNSPEGLLTQAKELNLKPSRYISWRPATDYALKQIPVYNVNGKEVVDYELQNKLAQEAGQANRYAGALQAEVGSALGYSSPEQLKQAGIDVNKFVSGQPITVSASSSSGIKSGDTVQFNPLDSTIMLSKIQKDINTNVPTSNYVNTLQAQIDNSKVTGALKEFNTNLSPITGMATALSPYPETQPKMSQADINKVFGFKQETVLGKLASLPQVSSYKDLSSNKVITSNGLVTGSSVLSRLPSGNYSQDSNNLRTGNSIGGYLGSLVGVGAKGITDAWSGSQQPYKNESSFITGYSLQPDYNVNAGRYTQTYSYKPTVDTTGKFISDVGTFTGNVVRGTQAVALASALPVIEVGSSIITKDLGNINSLGSSIGNLGTSTFDLARSLKSEGIKQANPYVPLATSIINKDIGNIVSAGTGAYEVSSPYVRSASNFLGNLGSAYAQSQILPYATAYAVSKPTIDKLNEFTKQELQDYIDNQFKSLDALQRAGQIEKEKLIQTIKPLRDYSKEQLIKLIGVNDKIIQSKVNTAVSGYNELSNIQNRYVSPLVNTAERATISGLDFIGRKVVLPSAGATLAIDKALIGANIAGLNFVGNNIVSPSYDWFSGNVIQPTTKELGRELNKARMNIVKDTSNAIINTRYDLARLGYALGDVFPGSKEQDEAYQEYQDRQKLIEGYSGKQLTKEEILSLEKQGIQVVRNKDKTYTLTNPTPTFKFGVNEMPVTLSSSRVYRGVGSILNAIGGTAEDIYERGALSLTKKPGSLVYREEFNPLIGRKNIQGFYKKEEEYNKDISNILKTGSYVNVGAKTAYDIATYFTPIWYTKTGLGLAESAITPKESILGFVKENPLDVVFLGLGGGAKAFKTIAPEAYSLLGTKASQSISKVYNKINPVTYTIESLIPKKDIINPIGLVEKPIQRRFFTTIEGKQAVEDILKVSGKAEDVIPGFKITKQTRLGNLLGRQEKVLQIVKPKVLKSDFKGLATVTSIEGKTPIINILGKTETRRVIKEVNGVKSLGGTGAFNIISSVGKQAKSKGASEIYDFSTILKTSKLSKDGVPFSKLSQAGKTTTELNEKIAVKKIADFKTSEAYKQGSLSKIVNPNKEDLVLSKARVIVKKGEPSITISDTTISKDLSLGKGSPSGKLLTEQETKKIASAGALNVIKSTSPKTTSSIDKALSVIAKDRNLPSYVGGVGGKSSESMYKAGTEAFSATATKVKDYLGGATRGSLMTGLSISPNTSVKITTVGPSYISGVNTRDVISVSPRSSDINIGGSRVITGLDVVNRNDLDVFSGLNNPQDTAQFKNQMPKQQQKEELGLVQVTQQKQVTTQVTPLITTTTTRQRIRTPIKPIIKLPISFSQPKQTRRNVRPPSRKEKFLAITRRRGKEVVLAVTETPQQASAIAKRDVLSRLSATATVRSTSGRKIQLAPDMFFRQSKRDKTSIVQRQYGFGGRLASKSERAEILFSKNKSKGGFKI